MTSAILYREGTDLDDLLAELDTEHDGAVEVVEVSHNRDGGVMGFFARRRVGVHYTLSPLTAAPLTAAPLTAAPLTAAPLTAASAHPGGSSFADVLLASEPVDTFTRSSPAAQADVLDTSPLDALLDATDEAEATSIVETGRASASYVEAERDDSANVEFARMLLDMAARKAAERKAAEDLAADVDTERGVEPGEPVGAGAHTAAAQHRAVVAGLPDAAQFARAEQLANAEHLAVSQHAVTPVADRSAGAHRVPPAKPVAAVPPATDLRRTQFTLRRQLVEIGIPVSFISGDSADAYRVIEQLVQRLPKAPPFAGELGELIAVVGPSADALRTAEQLCTKMRLDPDSLLLAGCRRGGAHSGGDLIRDRWHAAETAVRVREAREAPRIVVIATDFSGALVDDESDAERWAGDIVTALLPDQLYLVVDAKQKPADTRTLMGEIGTPTALAVIGAQRTASPASVWELDVPVSLLDGRPATRGTWAVLLIDKLAALDD